MPHPVPPSLRPLIEELESALLLADPDAPPTLAAAIQALAALSSTPDVPVAIAGRLDAAGARIGSQRVEEVSAGLAEAEAALRALPAAFETSGAAPAAVTAVVRDAETVELLGEFLGEAADGLSQADEILMAADGKPPSPERVNALFRVFHSIKGLAACLDVPDVTGLAHATENLLNKVREGTLSLQGDVLDRVFEATAQLRALLEVTRGAVEAGTAIPTQPELRVLLEKIQRTVDGVRAEPEPAQPAPVEVAAPAEVTPTPVEASAASEPAPVAAAPGPTPSADEHAAVAEPSAAPVTGGTRIRETLKVDLGRVESVVEMIGELIIVESMVVNAPEITALQSLKVRNYLGQLSKISRDLQDVAMRMRMVPVRGVFQKMARMTRDLAHQTGKRVTLVQSGEGTEMDRQMVERLEDPLVHMIRNAVDHAIEPAAERVAHGKPEQATLRLSAIHEGGNIVIEVADDGRGLDRDRIVAKAIERGLIPSADGMSDGEIYELIFAPGFSTKAQVTELSGRGVGMDVVKRAIEGMRGRVAIRSEPGQGTSFRLVLPLTLAIIDGMLVACGRERYILPSLAIVESLQPRREMISSLRGRDEFVDVRGDLLPLVRLARLLDIPDAQQDATQALVVVVETMGRRIGILVDDVVSQQQVVIKPMGSGMQETAAHFSGAAILSDGRVGLILNVDRLSSQFTRRASSAGRSHHIQGADAPRAEQSAPLRS